MGKLKKSPDIEFGSKYRDRITGFEGTCTGIASYITGCDQVLLVPRVDEKGGFREGQWFDDSRLDVVKEQRPVRSTGRPGADIPPARSY